MHLVHLCFSQNYTRKINYYKYSLFITKTWFLCLTLVSIFKEFIIIWRVISREGTAQAYFHLCNLYSDQVYDHKSMDNCFVH